MQIGIIGTGRVGSALGSRWAKGGHRVVYGCRDLAADEVRVALEKSGPNASAASVAETVAASHVVLLAIPWGVTRQVLESAGSLAGKILLDCINPLKPGFSGLDVPADSSTAEQIAAWFPQATVVKAFNTVGDAAMVDPLFGGQKASMFYCGDDAEAKAVVAKLTTELALEPVDSGPLKNARYLEALAMLYIHLAIFGGWGAHCAFRLVKR